jgi:hypothetical protein
MSQTQTLETAISQLPALDEHLVRDFAHQVQQLLDRYKNPHLAALALDLVNAHLLDSIIY